MQAMFLVHALITCSRAASHGGAPGHLGLGIGSRLGERGKQGVQVAESRVGEGGAGGGGVGVEVSVHLQAGEPHAQEDAGI